MSTSPLWNVTLTDFKCSSTLLELSKVSLEQQEFPSMVKLDINGTAFDFAFGDQLENAETVDSSSAADTQAKQMLQFSPPLTFEDGSYSVSISFQSKDETIFSPPEVLEPINLAGCIATNTEDNSINDTFTPTTTIVADQTEEVPNPTSTLFEPVTTSWVIESLSTQSENIVQVNPTLSPEVSIGNTDDANSTESQFESQEQDEAHGLYMKDTKSIVPFAILVCLLGLVIFFIVRRCRKVRAKREKTSYYVYDDEFNASEEGRH